MTLGQQSNYPNEERSQKRQRSNNAQKENRAPSYIDKQNKKSRKNSQSYLKPQSSNNNSYFIGTDATINVQDTTNVY